MFSSTIIYDYDSDENGIFDRSETETVEEMAFSNLQNYNYFIYLANGNREIEIEKVDNFAVEKVEEKVRYIFFVPFKAKAANRTTEIKIGVFDNTYFCDVIYVEENPVTIIGNASIESSFRLVEDAENAYWGEQIIPKVILLQFKKK